MYTNLSIYLSIYLFIYLSIYKSIRPSIPPGLPPKSVSSGVCLFTAQSLLTFSSPFSPTRSKDKCVFCGLGNLFLQEHSQLAHISPIITDLLAGKDMPLSANHYGDRCGRGRLGRWAGEGMHFTLSYHSKSHSIPNLWLRPDLFSQQCPG